MRTTSSNTAVIANAAARSRSSNTAQEKFVCAGSEPTSQNRCEQSWRNRQDAIENCQKIGCSHIGKFRENREDKFIILVSDANGYILDSNQVIVRTLTAHLNQTRDLQSRQRFC